VCDFLLGGMEKYITMIVVIVAGYRREMGEFNYNQGLNSRFPFPCATRLDR